MLSKNMLIIFGAQSEISNILSLFSEQDSKVDFFTPFDSASANNYQYKYKKQ